MDTNENVSQSSQGKGKELGLEIFEIFFVLWWGCFDCGIFDKLFDEWLSSNIYMNSIEKYMFFLKYEY